MLKWLSRIVPLTTSELLANTDQKRIRRAQSQIEIVGYEQEFIIRKLPLYKRIVSFLTRNPVNTVFVKFIIATKNIKNGNNHQVILEFPYLKNMSSYALSSIPIKVYSSTADFKFRFAWELNQLNNIYLNEEIKNKLGIALTEQPAKVKPLGSPQLDKHLYAVISNIDRLQIKY